MLGSVVQNGYSSTSLPSASIISFNRFAVSYRRPSTKTIQVPSLNLGSGCLFLSPGYPAFCTKACSFLAAFSIQGSYNTWITDEITRCSSSDTGMERTASIAASTFQPTVRYASSKSFTVAEGRSSPINSASSDKGLRTMASGANPSSAHTSFLLDPCVPSSFNTSVRAICEGCCAHLVSRASKSFSSDSFH